MNKKTICDAALQFSRHVRSILAALPLLFSSLVMFSCSSPEETPPRAVRTFTVRLIHTAESTAVVERVRALLARPEHRLSDGSEVKLETAATPGFESAARIARGELKPHLWLAPNSSLVNYSNKNVRNLGAPQVDCRKLFATPFVVAVNSRFRSQVAPTDATMRLLPILQGGAPFGSLLLSRALPERSDAGLLSLLESQSLLRASEPAGDTFTAMDDSEKLFSRYASRDRSLLTLALNSSATERRLVLTTEQQLASFNDSLQRSSAALIAVYPEEGSVWNDYTLCRSDADWVAIPEKRASLLVMQLFASEEAQVESQRSGFRPVIYSSDPLKARAVQQGIDLKLPATQLAPLGGEDMATVLQEWPRLRRSEATALILDLSGSMEGDSLSGFSKLVRVLIGKYGKEKPVALVTFATDVTVLSPLTRETKALYAQIDELKASGGSAIYDALAAGIAQLRTPEAAGFQKRVILFTDGEDKNSRLTLLNFLNQLRDRISEDDLTISIFAVERPGANYADLEQIAALTGGIVRRLRADATLQDVEAALTSS